MKYIIVKQVKKRIKELNKKTSRGFLHELDCFIDYKIKIAVANAGKFKVLKREDLNIKYDGRVKL